MHSKSAPFRSIGTAIIQALEAEGFPVSLEERKGTYAQIFGQRVRFELVENARETSRREVKLTPTWTRTEIDYQPSGLIEFRVGEYRYSPRRPFYDGKKRRLEDLLPQCLGALLREARDLRIQQNRLSSGKSSGRRSKGKWRSWRGTSMKKKRRCAILEAWVTAWARAQQMRDFIASLEKMWAEQGLDLSPEAPKGQRTIWMKQQADRLDPMLPYPPSILDRKGELKSWWRSRWSFGDKKPG